MIAVKNQAPTRSLLVAGGITEPGTILEILVPAEGSETLVPPVELVRGTGCDLTVVLIRTSNADNCWPGPLVPSQVEFIVHRRPHAVLPGKFESVPQHCFIAAVAEDLSRGIIIGSVKGAT